MESTVIKTEKLFFKYPNSRDYALIDVNLTVKQGDFLAIIGQNGAGKTTLTKHFNGLYKPTEGNVFIMGKDIRGMPTTEIIKLVGYCYQNPDHQLFCRTVYEEVAYGPRNLGLAPDKIDRNVSEALKVTELEDKKDRYPFTLGRGERQRLAIASVIAMGSPILIVDEPTTGLDKRGARKIMDLLKSWNQQGHTVIVITHDMAIVAAYVPRTVVMSNGRVIADGPTREILREKALLDAAFIKQPQILRLARELAPWGVPDDVLTSQEMYEALLTLCKTC
ncbi:energy-coupling factor ABC transporter ATP-binding protein [Thermanaeromonas sp. C210]|uniref:energy-coupling factor ABC transporter ATP-binding protein n=1 Tax=Thermanaeromonas sp. C210 TaxID=2731925 RepID=UPI00155B9795|nr:ABC transporter ATP-binding protein [Thermanaeromonas sp. C210]GFN22353.1 hypothetical protein TAMC210_06690 [Thermanaeromonas sp. C210]